MKKIKLLTGIAIMGVFLLSNCKKEPELKAVITVVSSAAPGDSIILNASQSVGDNLQYEWTVTGSTVTGTITVNVYNNRSVSASFIPEMNGTYDIKLRITCTSSFNETHANVTVTGGYSFLISWSTLGISNVFSKYKIIATDSFLFVNDADNAKIKKFDHDGNYLGALNFSNPFYIHDTLLYVVSDTNINYLHAFNLNFTLINSFFFPTSLLNVDDISGNDKKALITLGGGSEPFLMSLDLVNLTTNFFGNLGTGQLTFQPNGKFSSAYDNGNFFVTDVGNYRVQILDNSFSYVGEFSTIGERRTVLNSPSAIGVNAEHIIVANSSSLGSQIDFYDRTTNAYLYALDVGNYFEQSLSFNQDKLFVLVEYPQNYFQISVYSK